MLLISKYLDKALDLVFLASALAFFIISMTEIGLAFPQVLKELNSPSVVTPETIMTQNYIILLKENSKKK